MFRVRQEHAQALSQVLTGTLPARIAQRLLEQGFQVARDDKSRSVLATDTRGFSTQVTFTPAGHPSAVALPSGQKFAFEANEEDRLSAVTFPGNERLEFGYDTRGNILSLRRPELLSYELSYDESDRPTHVIYPDNTSASFHYNSFGLERYTNRLGSTTTFARDEAGQKCTITDPLGRTTTFLLEAKNRLSVVQFPDGSEQRFARDDHGLIQDITRRDGEHITISYDAQPGAIAFQWPDGNTTRCEITQGVHRAYKFTNANETATIIKDSTGRPISEQTSAGTTEYAYDSDGRLSQTRTPWGETIEYRYDGDGRLESIRDWGGRETLFEYAANGEISTIRYGGKIVESRDYGRLGGMSRATIIDTLGYTCSEQTYKYDLCDRLVELSDAWGPSTEEMERRRLILDAEGRVLAEIDPITERVLAEYEYDAKGNLTHDNGSPVHFGPMDEPISYCGREISYDGCGNMVHLPSRDGGELLCTFGGDGSLTQVRQDDLLVEFRYDALGRRISKTVGRSKWRYGWAGANLLWEEWTQYPGAEPVRRDYIYHPDGITPLAFRERGRTYWMQTDCRKAVIRVFDDDGDIVWRARYDSFGKISIETNLIRQPLRLAGQYEDEETGLYYNFARYYCPWIKSYITLDPSWPYHDATNYSYANNDPWNKIDPLGSIAFLVVVGVIAAGAAIGAIVGGLAAYFGHGDILVGAVTGAIEGAFMAGGFFLGPLGEALCNAAGTVIANVVEQWLTGQEICWKCAIGDGIESLIIDAVTFKLSRIPFVSKIIDKFTKRIDEILGSIWQKLKGKPELDTPNTKLDTPDPPQVPEVKPEPTNLTKKELNKLKPSSTYNVNGYTYQTDDLGRVTSVTGKLKLGDAPRNKYRQSQAGGSDRLESDQGGHLIATRFEGSGEGINLVAQDAKLNQVEWKKMENEWAKLTKEGKEVEVNIRPVYDEASKRPSSFEVDYTVDGIPAETQVFTNADP